MKTYSLIWAFALGVLAALTGCSDNGITSTVDTKAFDTGAFMDTSYAPGDNFFMYGNGKWYNSATVGDGVKDNVGVWYDANAKLMTDMKNALDADANGHKLLADFSNMNSTTDAALKMIATHIHEFDGISTKEEAWAALGKASKMGYKTLIALTTYIKNGTMGLLYRWPKEEEMTEDVAATSGYLQAMGYSESDAKAIASSAAAAKAALKATYSYTDYSTDNMSYNPTLEVKLVPITRITTTGGGMNVVNAMSQTLGIDNSSNVYMPNDMGGYIDAICSLTPEQIRSIIACDIAKDYKNTSLTAHNICEKKTDTADSFYSNLITSSEIGYFTSVIYTKAVVTDERKAAVTQVAEDLRDALRTKISTLDWMSSTTKSKALDKLDAMKMWIGRPDKWDETHMPTLTGTSLAEDLRLIRASQFELGLSLKGASRTEKAVEFEMTQEQNLTAGINSFYDPFVNAMFIFPCFMLPPFYDTSYSDAYNYACFTVIGHEMTHGFDNIGGQFDKDGNFSDWWTVADKLEFENRQQNIINCYNNLEVSFGNDPFVGIYDNGKVTLSENIADIGGSHLAYNAYMAKLQQDGYSGDELVKQQKKFFIGLCHLWRMKKSVAGMQKYLTNVHSLPKERVNGMAMNSDPWYEVFNVTSKNKLYLPKEKRADIW
jgi:putative endopeptidase